MKEYKKMNKMKIWVYIHFEPEHSKSILCSGYKYYILYNVIWKGTRVKKSGKVWGVFLVT